MGSLRDREVACSASDLQSLNFESCVWRAVSSQSSHHPQEVLHFIFFCIHVTVIMMIFTCSGHKGDWALHHYAIFFRSAGFHNYASYSAHYVLQMKGLNKKLQDGTFVRLIPGIYNLITQLGCPSEQRLFLKLSEGLPAM